MKTIHHGIRRFILLSAFVLSSPLVFAWGGLGHKAVAVVAWEELKTDKNTRDAITAICLEAPEIFDGKTGEAGLEGAAIWPDFIREQYRKDENTGPDEPLHIFEDIDVSLASEADKLHFADYKVDGKISAPHGQSAIQAIKLSFAALKKPNATPREKAEALAFLAHCVGDIHQPLHAGNAKDLGGNSIDHLHIVTDAQHKGRQLKLHGIWDGGLFEKAGITTPEKFYAESLRSQVAGLKAEATGTMKPEDWAAASHALALQYAYKDENGHVIADNDDLTMAYVQRGLPVAEKQVVLAGLRLASLLADALGH